MDTNVQDGLHKRSLEEIQGVSGEEEVKEKRPRLEYSGVSDISDATDVDVILVPSRSEEDCATEVIYELSPDNHESLLSVADSSVHADSPKEKEDMIEKSEDEKEEIFGDKGKEDKEESSSSEVIDDSSNDGDDENNDDISKPHEDSDDSEDTEDIKDSKGPKTGGNKVVHEDSDSSEDTEDIKDDKGKKSGRNKVVHKDSDSSEDTEDIKDNNGQKSGGNKVVHKVSDSSEDTEDIKDTKGKKTGGNKVVHEVSDDSEDTEYIKDTKGKKIGGNKVVHEVSEDSGGSEGSEDIKGTKGKKDRGNKDSKGKKVGGHKVVQEDSDDSEDIRDTKGKTVRGNKVVHGDSDDSVDTEDIKSSKGKKAGDKRGMKDDIEMLSDDLNEDEKHLGKNTKKNRAKFAQEATHSEEDEDSFESSDEESDAGIKKGEKIKKPEDVVDGVSSESSDEEQDEKKKQKPKKSKDVVDGDSSESSDEEQDEKKKEKPKKPEDALDGEYIGKSVEDLRDLQEDIHKELAQITVKSIQKKKHKKVSSRREKRHKEKSSSRYQEKERSREEGHHRKEEENRHRDFDEKPWFYDSRREKPNKEERRSRGEKSSNWGRAERSPKRFEKNWRETGRIHKEETMVAELKEPGASLAEIGARKGPISDSLREMIRAGVKEMKNEKAKDMRGFGTEIIDYESDQSVEHDILRDKMSDVSASSRERSPEVPKLPPYLPAILGCRNVEEFQWLNRIEEGTYGVVYRAKDKQSGEIVALKKLKMEKEKEGFPITSLREINTLLKAQHPNIVTVQEIVVGNNMDKIYIVMDFVEHDLKALMETMTQAFLGGEIKTIMIQLLRAVNHLHDNWILHRDIKTSNLLLSNKGILKVGDFGLAREYGSPLKPYTPIVVTLWYRSPELLLGAKEYSTPVDLWSVGCVFAELLTMKPLFNGQSEISQINKIFKELGTPSDKIWPGPPAYSEYPATKKMSFAEYPYNNLRNKFGATLTDNGFDLLNSFLTYDPKRRITADAALKHQYFKESPKPVDPSMFPSWPARSEGAKKAKKASPKAPEGGNFYQTLSGDGDGAFHIPVGKSQGSSAVSGFTLKF